MKPVLIVMAAGLGSRYGGLKQMESVTSEGEIILDFAVYDAMKAGFEDIVFVIKPEMEEAFNERVIVPMKKHLNVSYVFQEINRIPEGFKVPEGRIKPWGTCHAVMAADELIDGPFAVINSDDYYGPDAFRKVYDFLSKDTNDSGYCMAGYYVENTLSELGSVTRGVCETDTNGNLVSIKETKNIGWIDEPGGKIGIISDKEAIGEIEKGTVVSMNFWGFKKPMMDCLKKGFIRFLENISANEDSLMTAEYLLPIEIGSLLEENRISVKVLNANDKWYGVTYKEDKPVVKKAFREMKTQGLYPEKLWE